MPEHEERPQSFRRMVSGSLLSAQKIVLENHLSAIANSLSGSEKANYTAALFDSLVRGSSVLFEELIYGKRERGDALTPMEEFTLEIQTQLTLDRAQEQFDKTLSVLMEKHDLDYCIAFCKEKAPSFDFMNWLEKHYSMDAATNMSASERRERWLRSILNDGIQHRKTDIEEMAEEQGIIANHITDPDSYERGVGNLAYTATMIGASGKSSGAERGYWKLPTKSLPSMMPNDGTGRDNW